MAMGRSHHYAKSVSKYCTKKYLYQSTKTGDMESQKSGDRYKMEMYCSIPWVCMYCMSLWMKVPAKYM
uniref:Uncharacterized protein n=1 Tax=Anguilla anguilla TaxID=7936 RepID=A0A0E9PGK7_ANGAN